MEGNGIGLGDAMLLAQRNNACMDGGNMWNNPFVYMVWMSMLNGGGWGGWGGNGNAAAQGALTRAELAAGLDNQDVKADLRGTQNGLADGFYAMNTSVLNGFNGVQRDLCQGFNGVNNAITESRFAAQQCCCETNRSIDALKAENYKNTCEITNAIHAEGESTRALIQANTMQALRDKLEDKDREILYYKLKGTTTTPTTAG